MALPYTVENIAKVENLLQMREDAEWEIVWGIMLSHIGLSDAEIEEHITEDDELEAYIRWCDLNSDLKNAVADIDMAICGALASGEITL